MVGVVKAERMMMYLYFFERGGVRHLGNLGGAMIPGMEYEKVARGKE